MAAFEYYCFDSKMCGYDKEEILDADFDTDMCDLYCSKDYVLQQGDSLCMLFQCEQEPYSLKNDKLANYDFSCDTCTETFINDLEAGEYGD